MLFGRVEWFNFKKGFGNIKVVDPASDMNDNTFFVHYSNITANCSFKRLYPGEYVSFVVGKHNDRDVAKEVTGVNGGPLLVENTEYSYRIIKSFENSADVADIIIVNDDNDPGDP